MGNSDECEKRKLIEAFVKDTSKLEKVIATAERILKFNDDHGPCTYSLSERAVTAHDVVMDLVKQALCNLEKWNIEKMPEFDGWIITRLRNKKWNLVREILRPLYSRSKQRTEIDQDTPNSPTFRPTVSLQEQIEQNGFDPPGDTDHVREFEEQDCIDALRRELDGRITDSFVLEGIINKQSSKEIAADLNLGVSEVELAKKRIRRKIDRLLPPVDRLR